jgi:tetratricopeptide (TPR) repeat protein
VERKDVLSGFFFALTLWAWSGHIKKRNDITGLGPMAGLRHLTPNYYAALGFFALGLLAKSMLVTLPGVLLLLDWWPLRRTPRNGFHLRQWMPLVVEKLPFIILSGIVGVITLNVQSNAVQAASAHSFIWRIGNALESISLYLQHSLWPAKLCFAYGPTVTAVNMPRVFIALFLCITVTAFGIWARKKSPWWLAGWLWFLGMLLPTVDIMQAGINARADRYTYLPQVGLCLLAAWAVKTLAAGSKTRRALAICLGLGTVLISAGAAFHQTTFWHDSETVWTRSVACSPDYALAQNQLGRTLAGESKWGESAPHFQRALQNDPGMFEAALNLGLVRMNQGEYQQAADSFHHATVINANSPDAFYLLGTALNRAGMADEARQSLNHALSLAQAQSNTDLAAEIQAAAK